MTSHDIERHEALYPRIIVHPELANQARSYRHGNADEPLYDPMHTPPPPGELILTDDDGRDFLDYSWFAQHHMPDFDAIHQNFIDDEVPQLMKDPELVSKAQWVVSYHDRKDRYRGTPG